MEYEDGQTGRTMLAETRASQRRDETDERPAEVEEQVVILNNNVDRLQSLVARLEDRFASVIRQDGVDRVPSPTPAQPGIVALADRLRDRNDDIGRSNDRLQQLLERCEL